MSDSELFLLLFIILLVLITWASTRK